MEIKNDIAINIDKEVTLALLSIYESMDLKHIIFHVSYLLDKLDPSCTIESHPRSANAWDLGKQLLP